MMSGCCLKMQYWKHGPRKAWGMRCEMMNFKNVLHKIRFRNGQNIQSVSEIVLEKLLNRKFRIKVGANLYHAKMKIFNFYIFQCVKTISCYVKLDCTSKHSFYYILFFYFLKLFFHNIAVIQKRSFLES